MKHGKTKEEEAKEVALVQALAEKRLREVCNLEADQNWDKKCSALIRFGNFFANLMKIGNILQPL